MHLGPRCRRQNRLFPVARSCPSSSFLSCQKKARLCPRVCQESNTSSPTLSDNMVPYVWSCCLSLSCLVTSWLQRHDLAILLPFLKAFVDPVPFSSSFLFCCTDRNLLPSCSTALRSWCLSAATTTDAALVMLRRGERHGQRKRAWAESGGVSESSWEGVLPDYDCTLAVQPGVDR